MTEFRVGVVGCGWVGTNRHLPSYDRDKRAKVVAVYDHNAGKSATLASEFDIPTSHGSMSDFLAEDLDIVSIATPPWTHHDVSIQAMEAGCNVLTEKPMAMNPSETKAMIRSAVDEDRSLGVVHNFLFAPSLRKAKRIVEAGDLGEIQSVLGVQTSSRRRQLPDWYPSLPGQLFFDESPHLLYLLEEFLGELTVESSSIYRDESRDQSVQTVQSTLRGSSGQHGTISMTFDTPLSEWQVAVIGRRKMLVVDIFRDILLEFGEERAHNVRDVVGTSLRAMTQELAGMAQTGVRYARGNLLFGMDELTSQFLDSIETGSTPPVTGKDGQRVVRLMHDILEGGGVATDFSAP